jgi:hypothetical protein
MWISNVDRHTLNHDRRRGRGQISSFLTSFPWVLSNLDKQTPVLEARMFMSVDLLCIMVWLIESMRSICFWKMNWLEWSGLGSRHQFHWWHRSFFMVWNVFTQFQLKHIHDLHELNHLHFHLHHFNQLWFLAMLQFFVPLVFHIVNHFHQFHLNQIHDWHELNHTHFQVHHFNQLLFHPMLKFFVQNVFHVVIHFHPFHLNQIHDWSELNHLHFHIHPFNQLWFHVMFNSSMVLPFAIWDYHQSRLKMGTMYLVLRMIFWLIFFVTS